MKRIWILALALSLMLCLCACSGENSPFTQTYTFPEGTSILGVEMTNMDKEAAWSKLEKAAQDYKLELIVDGVTVSIPGKDIGLTCSREDFMAAADALEAGTEADLSRIIRYQDAKLRPILNRNLNVGEKDAAIVYDEASGQFVLDPHIEGRRVDAKVVSDAIRSTIRTLTPQQTLTDVTELVTPALAPTPEQAQVVLEQFNKIAAMELSYTFGVDSSSPVVHQIPAEVIRSFLHTGEDGLTPSVDREAVAAYAEELAATYSTPERLDGFLTTGGEKLEMTIPYESCQVNTELLADDIFLCVSNGFTTERTAPYIGNSNPDMPYGGTYVEIDLTAQHLWYYKDGEQLISTDLVSGNVASSMNTPTGNFYVYSRSRGIYLEGVDYKTWVNFWMPFTGGYGMHDALWRDEFGGDIYLTDGSHGCVNLPYDAASTLFYNSTWGTRVIIYGGEGSVAAREQEIIGTTEHIVTENTEPFKLKMRSRYAWPDFYYESDNPDVATVSEDGIVTVNGIGTANIKVITTTENRYASAQTTVVVQVLCEDDNHQMGEPAVTTEATCEAGVQTTSCTKCGYSEEITLEPVYEHTFTDGTCSVCGKEE